MIKVNSQGVFVSLGGAIIKVNSPLLREIFEEAFEEGRRAGTEKVLVTVLVARLGPKAKAVKAELKEVPDKRLKGLLTLAATCPNLDAFYEALATRRGKRRTRKTI